jgi:hypothetical protein
VAGRQRSAPAAPQPHNAEPWEKREYLPDLPELEWLTPLRLAHIAACDAFYAEVQHTADLLHDGNAMRRWELVEVPDAFRAGQSTPPSPMQLTRARLDEKRDAVAEAALAAFAEIRARRAEVEPFADRVPPDLLRALFAGLGGAHERAVSDLRRRLAELEKPEVEDRGIENLTPELEASDAVVST